ncbi:tripartite tricarboxylate transporter substrate binding protein [uncultured Mailhella sp.]|uniref:tripartite tricarboxylate transporter substrate binding protein n=1 Tax=uncultured Mailhella sp. TaxID=1981031 RepID=UPI0025D45409|nr:tripartite tricarboxylate transporter substrate binding protein [uncultured Mailhella sp.]
MKWRTPHFFFAAVWLALLSLPVVPGAFASGSNVQLSIAFSPGGALDAVARTLAREAEKELGAKVIVQNVPGGGGMTGVARLAQSKPDGSRLTACVTNALIFIPFRNNAPYDPLKDVEPLLVFGQASPVLVTRPDAPWKDMDAFLAATREKGGDMRIGVPGLGTPSHIALAVMAANDPSLKWRFVPFGGPGEAEAALLGGHLDAAASGALPRIKNGQLLPLMVLAGTNLPALPNVPSLTDKGFSDPGRGDSSFILLAPAKTPEKTLEKISRAFEKAAESEAYRKTLEGFSVAPVLKNRQEAREFLSQAWQEEGNILKAAGIADMPAASPKKGTAGAILPKEE